MRAPCLFLLLVAAGWYDPASAAPVLVPARGCSRRFVVANRVAMAQSSCGVANQLHKGDSTSVSCRCICRRAITYPFSACAPCQNGLVPSCNAQHLFSMNALATSNPIVPVMLPGIPKWRAPSSLRNSNDLHIPEAISEAGPTPWTTVQIVTPIVVGVCIAILSGLLFFCYRRARHLRSAPYTLDSAPDSAHSGSHILYPTPGVRAHQRLPSNGWLHAPWAVFRVLPRPWALRPASAPKDPSWEIDREPDVLWIHPQDATADGPYRPAYSTSPPSTHAHPYPLHTPSGSSAHLPHAREMSDGSTSSRAALLPRVELPAVRAPSFLARFVRYTDGVRKSPGYRLVHVREERPGARFKIDRSRASTLEVNVSAEPAPGDGAVEEMPRVESPQPLEPLSADDDERSVLLISQTPGVDFSLSDAGSFVSEHECP